MKKLPALNYDSQGLIPAIIQDWRTKEVLMLAYMNEESLGLTLNTGRTHFYSRKRRSLWEKGETSGHFQIVKSVKYDCDEDTLLVLVEQMGVSCHTGNRTCFYREADFEPSDKLAPLPLSVCDVLNDVYEVLLKRKKDLPRGSYTAELFKGGLDRILKKVGEEASEVILASKNDSEGEIIYEMADLWFHSLIVLAHHDIKPDKILEELSSRRGED